jgi:hypothetical protein
VPAFVESLLGQSTQSQNPAKAAECSRDFHQFDSVAPPADPKAMRLLSITARLQ